LEQEKSQDDPSANNSPALHEACKKVKDIARRLGGVMVRGPSILIRPYKLPYVSLTLLSLLQ
jgi:hypothetical protein